MATTNSTTTTPPMAKERPIIMGAESIAAILANTKTQTRRVVKPQPPDGWERNCWFSAPVWGWTADEIPAGKWHKVRCPYGQPGDRLWVREGWATVGVGDRFANGRWIAQPVYYRADAITYDRPPAWRSPLFMPRSLSRITLTVTAIRVERLHAISEADALAEGMICEPDRVGAQYGPRPGEMTNRTAMAAYLRHWNTINAKRGYPWQSDCWVWVVEFARVTDG